MIVGLPRVEVQRHLLRALVVWRHQKFRVSASHLWLGAASPKGLVEAVHWRGVFAEAKVTSFVWSKRALAPDDADHLLPSGIVPVESVLHVCDATMIEVDFAD